MASRKTHGVYMRSVSPDEELHGHEEQRDSRQYPHQDRHHHHHHHELQQYHTHWEIDEEDEGEAAEEVENRLRTGVIIQPSQTQAHFSRPSSRHTGHNSGGGGGGGYNRSENNERALRQEDHHHHHHPPHLHKNDADDVGVVGRVGISDSNRKIPRGKFNVEFDYEDMIETTSSGSFSSAAYERHHHQVQQQQQHQQHQHQQHHHSHHPRSQSHPVTHEETHHHHPQARYFVESDNNQEDHQEAPTSPHSPSQPHVRPMNNNKGPYQHHPHGHRGAEIPEKFRDEKDGSEIYVVDTAYMKPPTSVYSHYSGKSRAPSEMSSVKTKTSRKGGVVVETMSAPNPCCPNTKGVCWLLVLVNLGLILVTLGFSIVLQLFDPPFVWYFGIAFLIVGFTALIASLIFCLHLCRESEAQRRRGLQPGEMYWTHHWQKRIALPGMTRHEVEKADDVSTVYSARNDPDDKYYSREDRRDMTPIHTYNHHHSRN